MPTNPPRKPSPLTSVYIVGTAFVRFLQFLTVVVILLFLIPIVTPYIKNINDYAYLKMALSAEHSVEDLVRKTIPTVWGGKDLTRWIVVIGMFILSGMLSRTAERFTGKVHYYRYLHQFDEWKASTKLSDNAIVLGPIQHKIAQLKNAKRRDREQLIKEFAETKRKLDEMGRDLAFLAIDIADSTGMKQGEERAIIEHDFREYKRFVERAFAAHGCLKSAWTPDGVMAAFNTVDAAVRAAREVIEGLERFNREMKYMKRDFTVRCGVNSGYVYFDESMPLEEISDRVIDIAGHMQKHAKPNSVCVAKPAIEPLNDRGGFEPAGRVIDGYEVYEWELPPA